MTSSVKHITVVSSNGHEFQMTAGAASQSKLLKRMLEDDDSISGKVIPLSNVNTVTLVKVMEYCQKHADFEATKAAGGEVSGEDDSDLKAWDAELVADLEKDPLFDLMKSAKFLEIEGLLDLTCEAVADMIVGKSAEEIRSIFNIEKDLTAEEEEQIRRENQSMEWAFD